MKNLKIRKEGLFVAVAFLLGSINVLYNGVFCAFLGVAFLINLRSDFRGFWENVKQEKMYLLLPIGSVLFLIIHYLCSLFLTVPYRASWSMVEMLLLYFLFIPLYLLSARDFVTPFLLRRFLYALCFGVLSFCFVKLFYITGTSIFTEPANALNLIYSGRFGGNMKLLGGFVYLEPQAIYIGITAIISYFFILENSIRYFNGYRLGGGIVLFILSIIFLSFTVTKGTILAFVCGALFLTIIYLRNLSRKFWLTFITVLFIGGLGIYLLIPATYISRINQAKQEIEYLREGKFQGGSIAPRYGLMKENFSHFNDFGLFGLGVYKGSAIREWYEKSTYPIHGITNAHNSFVEFWLIGGIPGLLFVFYFWWAPVLRMIRRKKYSWLTIAMLVTFFVAANTCVIIFLVDSKPFVVFMLAMSFLYSDHFVGLQKLKE